MGRTRHIPAAPLKAHEAPAVPAPKTMDEALGVISAQAQEMHLLRLMVAKLKVQLARSVHRQFGTSSERFIDEHGQVHPVQVSLLDGCEGSPLDKAEADPAKAKDGVTDRHIGATA